MKRSLISTLALAFTAAAAFAQSPPPAQPKSPSPPAEAMPAPKSDAKGADAAGLMPGANSFTQAQAEKRIADAGFGKVTSLAKDDQGIWRGKAEKDGKPVDVGLDYRGNVQVK